MTTSHSESQRVLHEPSGLAEAGATPATPAGSWLDYVSIARPDHWFKNVFMLLGIVLAYSYLYGTGVALGFQPGLILLALAATCILASSNYVINEILDAPTDRQHPVKCRRPIPSGRVRLPLAYAQWLALAAIGLAAAWAVNLAFCITGAVLLVMGMVYNVRPLRSKDVPYLDVVSESVNNPLRLALGWFVVSDELIPPLSLLISYWMIGAFFMATKRFAEYRAIGDPARAAAYRNSFRHYDDQKLLISMFFYATAAALFLGVFMIRFRLELILSIPLLAGFFSYYMHVALKDDSPVQAPEKLYREHGLMIYLVICVVAFISLMVLDVTPLYEWFNVTEPAIPTFWKV